MEKKNCICCKETFIVIPEFKSLEAPRNRGYIGAAAIKEQPSFSGK